MTATVVLMWTALLVWMAREFWNHHVQSEEQQSWLPSPSLEATKYFAP